MTLSTTVTRSKVDRYLAILDQAFVSLPAVAARREALAHAGAEGDDQLADRLAFQDGWWDQIDRLEPLCAAYDAAEMTDIQTSRFASLCASVLEQLQLIARLNLRSPSAPTIDALRSVTQHHGIMAKGA